MTISACARVAGRGAPTILPLAPPTANFHPVHQSLCLAEEQVPPSPPATQKLAFGGGALAQPTTKVSTISRFKSVKEQVALFFGSVIRGTESCVMPFVSK